MVRLTTVPRLASAIIYNGYRIGVRYDDFSFDFISQIKSYVLFIPLSL